MQVSILETKGTIWEGTAKQVNLPADEGDVTILDFHQPFLMKLSKGEVRLADFRANIKHGLAFMKSNTLKVFVET